MKNPPVRVADENHLLQELPVARRLGHNLPEDQQELLDHVVLARQHEPDDRHELRKVGARQLASNLKQCRGFFSHPPGC